MTKTLKERIITSSAAEKEEKKEFVNKNSRHQLGWLIMKLRRRRTFPLVDSAAQS